MIFTRTNASKKGKEKKGKKKKEKKKKRKKEKGMMGYIVEYGK